MLYLLVSVTPPEVFLFVEWNGSIEIQISREKKISSSISLSSPYYSFSSLSHQIPSTTDFPPFPPFPFLITPNTQYPIRPPLPLPPHITTPYILPPPQQNTTCYWLLCITHHPPTLKLSSGTRVCIHTSVFSVWTVGCDGDTCWWGGGK